MRPLYPCLVIVLSALAGAAHGQAPRIESFFSPHDDCTKEIVNRIDAAKREVLVQAYRFDSKPIAEALIRAKKERHVDVQVLLDSRHRADINDVADLLQAADIPTRTYAPPRGIDHNKVIVVDKETVLTGSFNFTEHAKANAENLHIDRDTDDAARYVADWKRCAAHADAKPMANAAKAAAKAAKAVAKAVKAAKAKAAAYTEAEADWAEAEADWEKAEKEAAADAKSADPTVAKWAAIGVKLTRAAKLAARTANTTAEPAKEAWTKAATVDEAWSAAEAAWAAAAKQAAEQVAARTKTGKESKKAVDPLFAKADACAEASDRAWADAIAKGAAHTKAADEADVAGTEAEKAANAAEAAIKQAAGGR